MDDSLRLPPFRSRSSSVSLAISADSTVPRPAMGALLDYPPYPQVPTPPNEPALLPKLHLSQPSPDHPWHILDSALNAATAISLAGRSSFSAVLARPSPGPIPPPSPIALQMLTPPPSPPAFAMQDDLASLPLPTTSPTVPAFSLYPSQLGRSRLARVVLLLSSTFILSTALLLAALYSLPVHLPSFPKTLSDLAALGSQLRAYAESQTSAGKSSGHTHVLSVLAYALLWSNAWSIPGSIILNVLTGLLLPPITATIYLTVLTTVGSLLSTLLAIPAVPLFPSLSLPSRSPALLSLPQLTASHLVLLRLSGLAPWSLLNIYAALHRTPFETITWTCIVGCAPWSAVTAQIGALIRDLGTSGLGSTASVGEVLRQPAVLMKLVALSLLGGAPVLAKGWVKSWMTGADDGTADEDSATAGVPRGWLTWSRVWPWSKVEAQG